MDIPKGDFMKKNIFLYSVLILCGCSGGSQSPSTIINHIPVPDTSVASNEKITAMASEILIPTDSASQEIIRTSSNVVNFNGKSYLSYRLDNVNFETADAFSPNETEDNLSFIIDENGKITALNFKNEVAKRIEDTNDFEIAIFNPYINETANTSLSYNSFAKDIGLRYADFGMISVNGIDGHEWLNEDEHIAYIGGYDAKNISTEDFNNNITFKGLAKGSVSDLIIEDTNATLSVNKDTLTETLSASFNNWYDVKVTKNNDDTVTFNISGDYSGPYTINQPTPNLSDNAKPNDKEAISFESEYYGTVNKPEEAVVLFDYYQGTLPDGNEQDYTHINIGFGGKAQ